MIALLRGRVVATGLDEVVLDVGGVGYRVRVAPGSVRAALGDEVVLHTHLAVREDAMTLYGFPEASARDLYENLLGVTGVGPKLALAVIGTLGVAGLQRAVVAEDVTALTAVPGVGKKGAQRLLLELRGRLPALTAGELADGVPLDLAAPGDARSEVRAALAGLGYGAVEIERALDRVADVDDATPEGLLRAALRALAPAAS